MGKKKNRLLGFLCFAAVLIPLFSLNVFAAGEDIFTLGDKIIRDVYNHIAGISTVLAALMSAIMKRKMLCEVNQAISVEFTQNIGSTSHNILTQGFIEVV